MNTTTKTKKLTAAERAANDRAARLEKSTMDYAARVLAMSRQPVVETTGDTFALARHVTGLLFGNERAVDLLYSAMSEFENARSEFKTAADRLKRVTSELDDAFAQNRFYSSQPVQSRGIDVDVAHAKFRAAASALAHVSRFLGVHVPALYDAASLAQRAKQIACVVVRADMDLMRNVAAALRTDVPPTFGWNLRLEDGSLAMTADGATVLYETEAKAWRAHAAHCGAAISEW